MPGQTPALLVCGRPTLVSTHFSPHRGNIADASVHVDQLEHMTTAFKAAMAKLAVIGQDPSQMVDCSELIPTPPPFTGAAHLPAGLTMNDIEQAVSHNSLMGK